MIHFAPLLSITCLLLFNDSVRGFSFINNPITKPQPLHISSNMVLNLKPGQGPQLAAFSASKLAKLEEGGSPSNHITYITPINAARQFLHRIVTLPSQIIRIGTKMDNSIFENINKNSIYSNNISNYKSDDDVVLFPIVGFQYVKIKDINSKTDKFRAFPSTNCIKSCSITSRRLLDEPVYGSFSPACHLGDIHSNDEEYCGKPKTNVVE